MSFADRVDAGRRLAAALEPFRTRNPVVLALPRGGVPIGYHVARALGAPLDVIVVRKLGAPGHEELAVGAIARGAAYIDWPIVRQLGVSQAYLDQVTAAEERELERRERAYRQGRAALPIEGRTVILVDDGLATGATLRAALSAVRSEHPARIVVAVPVGAPESVARFREMADDVVCLEMPPDFRAVSLSYDDFSPTSDAEVVECLEAAR
ncbi:MAG TPA: phosphoribosyltransferase family protein [Gemmatimonadales bacterium]|jgi:predicted phosphoribosyltransferase|nr:phosphoribosyltransferase family protein [Gemmatimonadales bacterium]